MFEKPTRLRDTIIAGLFTIAAASLGAFLSNWDKIFGKTIEITYERKPTDDFAAETRYYFDISGSRNALELMLQKSTDNALKQMECAFSLLPTSDPELWNEINEAVRGEKITADRIIAALIPVYEKHISLREMQELNKLHSSGILETIAGKSSAITEDELLAFADLQKDALLAYARRIGSELNDRPDIVQIAELLKSAAATIPYYSKGLCPPATPQ